MERITYVNEDNGFSVIKIKAKGYPELVTLVGQLSFVNLGSLVELEGKWVFNSKFGRQFQVHSCVEKYRQP